VLYTDVIFIGLEEWNFAVEIPICHLIVGSGESRSYEAEASLTVDVIASNKRRSRLNDRLETMCKVVTYVLYSYCSLLKAKSIIRWGCRSWNFTRRAECKKRLSWCVHRQISRRFVSNCGIDHRIILEGGHYQQAEMWAITHRILLQACSIFFDCEVSNFPVVINQLWGFVLVQRFDTFASKEWFTLNPGPREGTDLDKRSSNWDSKVNSHVYILVMNGMLVKTYIEKKIQ